MFNNPFESFHDTVAEAKAAREQLDRLLTVSSLRELLLLVFVLALLAVLTVWLMFGVLDRNVVANATVLERADTDDSSHQVIRMKAWFSNEFSPAVRAGMPVIIKPVKDQGQMSSLRGNIRLILSQGISEELTVAGRAPITTKIFKISVSSEVDLSSYVGAECLLIIQLGQHSPIKLIVTTLL